MTTHNQPFGHCPVEGCRQPAMKGMPKCECHAAPVLEMTPLGKSYGTHADFRAQGWTDSQLIQFGYAFNLRNLNSAKYWKECARGLVDAARRAGFIVRIEQVSDGPPAMGNHRDVVTVYPVRK